MEYFHKRLDEMDIDYANHLYEIEGTLNENQAYELSTKTIGKEIRFTTDGSEPDSSSTVYEAPIPFTADMTLKAQVFDDDEPLGRLFTQEFLYHKGVGATISINKEPHKSYPGSGANGLINGIKGSDSRYGDSEWLGFWGEDLKIRVDFEQELGVNEIELRFYHAPGQWIYAPNDLKISSDPHAPFSKIKPVSKSGNFYNYKIDLKVASSAFILLVPNYGIIPEGHQGAGNKAWTFIDEIIIN
nr:chitobiase/beta-hexosaminidase C-terminal domain-containing protein [Nonlabens ulvanivorans]